MYQVKIVVHKMGWEQGATTFTAFAEMVLNREKQLSGDIPVRGLS